MFINSINNFGSYSRLSLEDINRMPKHVSSPVQTAPSFNSKEIREKNVKLLKIFTIAVSALAGLYIANRNNLFNPVMKETKKILKNPDTFEKINKYVSDNFNFDTCAKFTKRFLTKLANDSAQTEAFAKQANIISNNKADFDKLVQKVFSQIHDDKNINTLKRGLSIDIMDLYLPKIVQKLQKIKDKKQPYKNLQPEIVADLFKKGPDGVMPIEDLFYSVVNARVGKTIIDTVDNARILSELAS